MRRSSRIMAIAMLAAVVVWVAGTVSIEAQRRLNEDGVRANVPFAFIVEDTTFPAGRYEVERATEDNMNAWTIRSIEPHGRSAVFLTDSVGLSPNAKAPADELSFDRIGSRSYLQRIWMSGMGYELLQPHDVAQTNMPHDTVSVSAVP